MMNNALPEAFLNRVRGQLGKELPAFLRAVQEPFCRGIRFNPMKTISNELICDIRQAVPWADNAYYLSQDSRAGITVFHEAGSFYLQEPSAMLPAAVMNAQPGERILDLCAAPGGKSTQMGCAMQGKGLLVSNEPVPKRAAILSRNIERMGITNAVVISAWPDQLADKWPEMFDGVMVDAPCSGEGMFRRNPESILEWSPENTGGCAERQRGILNAAAKLVCPGGKLVYSTCTMNPAENEHNVMWFLSTHPEFDLESFSLPEADGSEGMFTCWPHRMKGEGQFVALLRKKGSEYSKERKNSGLPVADQKIVKSVRELIKTNDKMLYLFGSTVVELDDCPDLNKIRVLRAGLHLCEIKGTQIIPDHAYAMCFRKLDIPDYPLNGKEALRYMSGETINAEGKGWVTVSYRNLRLGWGKISDGIIKNHYPKGLRNGQLILKCDNGILLQEGNIQ